MEPISDFKSSLRNFWPELTTVQIDSVARYFELLRQENEKQNLTRLISVKDFIEGHVWDVRELHRWAGATFPAMDLGSGGGVPGLLSAALGMGPWILAESEKRKAEFLSSAAQELGLTSVQVFPGRAEDFLKKGTVLSVVARAVGPVERIYTWLRPCSTWNNLILFKGPGWAEEWKSFGLSKFRKELEVESEHLYSVGEEKKERRILRLRRVRRGK
jgi:16S rRNA (guanine(527)-N(7))-methyltransferase RsmG